MTALPPIANATGASVTEGGFKTWLTDLRAYLSEVLGATGGGQADPTSGSVFRRNALINGGLPIWQRGIGSTSCPAGSRTFLADRWYVNPSGAACTQQRSTNLPSGSRAQYSLELQGAASVTTVLIGQRIEAAEMPEIKRAITFSAEIYNGTGSAFIPKLLLGTPNAADNFATVVNRLTQDMQSCPDATWTKVSYTVNISSYTNIDNGLQVEIQVPSGSLVAGDTVRVTELQLAAAAVVTTFAGRGGLAYEYHACQRFYYVRRFLNGNYIALLQAFNTTSVFGILWFHPVPMVITPSVSISAIGDFSLADSSSSAGACSSGSLQGDVNAVSTAGLTRSSGLSAGNASILSSGSNNAAVHVNAEL